MFGSHKAPKGQNMSLVWSAAVCTGLLAKEQWQLTQILLDLDSQLQWAFVSEGRAGFFHLVGHHGVLLWSYGAERHKIPSENLLSDQGMLACMWAVPWDTPARSRCCLHVGSVQEWQAGVCLQHWFRVLNRHVEGPAQLLDEPRSAERPSCDSTENCLS